MITAGYLEVLPHVPWEAECCGWGFSQYADYEDHLANSPHHHYYGLCEIHIESERAQQAHSSTRRKICRWCRTDVGDNLTFHYQEYHMQCVRCDRWHAERAELERHLSKDHADVFCAPCKVLFAQPNELVMHRRSSVHQPKAVRCPHRACLRTFVNTPALVAHFEAGICQSGVTLEHVDAHFAYDCDHQQLFVRRESIFAKRRWSIPTHYGPFQCPCCPKAFDYHGQLLSHLDSPRHKNHDQKAYVCPSARCGKVHFYSLSALLLHQETDNCEMGHRRQLSQLVNRLLNIITQL
ncbi:hypothetical protein PTTG_05346 [Puccinia triticina 1-1 BBBD Race 1]|uniref:C2H2-type domain-containing protein n=1 Tax=Puccinia triticina (isolate 1-1 / race 1 (BBBD)) TaxID=630390 RepID=A0A0C4EWZ9_PUCT1|nr:hypothetical protein PTTG_05346 [Puccinia triticina 1-1 BBBD Race 1]